MTKLIFFNPCCLLQTKDDEIPFMEENKCFRKTKIEQENFKKDSPFKKMRMDRKIMCAVCG